MHQLQRFWKPLVGLLAILGAFAVTFVWPRNNGLDNLIDGSSQAQAAARERDPYDLTELRVLNLVIGKVNETYVEPARIQYDHMLLGALNAIQRSVAPVLVHYEGDSVMVQVADEKRSFRVKGIDSPWKLAASFQSIFEFLQSHLKDEELDLRDVEYAATNGMLRTLDPHSVLLTPEQFEEMQMSTRGEFGGLGIVISIREGNLTIMQPIPNTPAARAGLKEGDRIVKIDEESTLNMLLTDAVDRLRGPPGSSVSVWVTHKQGKGYSKAKRHDIVRAVIHIPSIEHRMLKDGIGYVKIRNFQGNTHEDMQRALRELHGKGLKGLVLDLRENPGGLLEQAELVADSFLESGTIVTTSSNDPGQREEKLARKKGTEPNYPMVVLVNGASASASEIVAGALKNHDRAVVVGQRTFGKGSVQVLYAFERRTALKLTIAQYLTPGDVSIQNVGIVPDVTIDPMTVDREDMDLAVDKEYLRESDLHSPLTHERARKQAETTVLRYYLPNETRRELREAEPEARKENEEEDEFLTRFSQMLLAKATTSDRVRMLEEARPVIDHMRDEELRKAVAELKRLGIDWSVGEDEGASDMLVEVSTNRPNNEVRAGEPFDLKVRVTNKGKEPLYQLRATTKSDFDLFSDRELVFGRLLPGQSQEWSTTLGICETKDKKRSCTIPRRVTTRADGVRIEFAEAHGHAPPPAEIRTTVRGIDRPQFAYAVQVADDVKGNGDGRVQLGEQATVYMLVENVGVAKAWKTQANLKNSSGAGILLHDGRFHLEEIAPGEERLVRFTFEVLPDFEKDEAKVEVSVFDVELREGVTEDVVIPVWRDGEKPKPRSGSVKVKAGATVFESPRADAHVVAEVEGGSVTVPVKAASGEFVRVDLGDGRPGWVRNSALSPGGGAGGRIAYDLNHRPPTLAVQHGDSLVTRGDTLTLTGSATDDQRVRDMYIFVGARKVFYKSNHNGKAKKHLAFRTQIPLHPGMNYVSVFARERADVVSRETFVVRRDGPDGSLLETPDYDEDLFGSEEPPEM